MVSARPSCLLPLGETAEAVLDDDHRAVDDEAEVDGAEAHQVAAGPRLHHADRGEQHRERDRERGDERGAEVPEHEEQHDDRPGSRPRRGSRSTVRIVASTSVDAVEDGLARGCRAAGSVRRSRHLSSTAAATVRLLAPRSMSAVPTTTSSPFSVALPVRSSRPMRDLARRRATRIGDAVALGDDDVGELVGDGRRRPAARTT